MIQHLGDCVQDRKLSPFLRLVCFSNAEIYSGKVDNRLFLSNYTEKVCRCICLGVFWYIGYGDIMIAAWDTLVWLSLPYGTDSGCLWSAEYG